MEWLPLLASIALSGGGGAAVAVGACKKFGERWLDAKFEERLARLKHDQAKEIEAVRQQVQWEFSRISKIHEKEFEVLPTAWLKLQEAHGRAANLVGRLREFADLDRMPDDLFREFVAQTTLGQSLKDQLLATAAGRRNNFYSDKRMWIDLGDAEEAQRDLNNYLIQHRILMSTELAEAFRRASIDLALVNSGYRTHKQYSIPDQFTESADRFSKLEPQLQQIGSLIQRRLNYEKA